MGKILRFDIRGGRMMDLADWLLAVFMFLVVVGVLLVVYMLGLAMGY